MKILADFAASRPQWRQTPYRSEDFFEVQRTRRKFMGVPSTGLCPAEALSTAETVTLLPETA
jgi:hypothetical protein